MIDDAILAPADTYIWRDAAGEPISCVEKLRVLRENDAELRQTLRDAFDDAVLMGVPSDQMRAHLIGLVEKLKAPGA